MEPRIAIHHREGSHSTRWIEVCRERGLNYSVVDGYACDVIERLRSMDVLLWHFHQLVAKDMKMARAVLRSAETMGLAVFPNAATCWHYDDKIGQKYLLEAVSAHLIPTYIFYELEEALAWIDQATYPKVFKMSRGASALNVRLVRSADEARKLARRAFGAGFKAVPSYWVDARTRMEKVRRKRNYRATLERLPRTLRNIRRANQLLGRENGYIYFQEFLPNNDHDTRITIIGNRAYGYCRGVRDNDFRASGSGRNNYDPKSIDLRCIPLAFEATERIGAQTLAFDYIYDLEGQPRLTEISYCYNQAYLHHCPGQWDRNLKWTEGHLWPEDAILDDMLAEAQRRGAGRAAPSVPAQPPA